MGALPTSHPQPDPAMPSAQQRPPRGRTTVVSAAPAPGPRCQLDCSGPPRPAVTRPHPHLSQPKAEPVFGLFRNGDADALDQLVCQRNPRLAAVVRRAGARHALRTIFEVTGLQPSSTAQVLPFPVVR